MTPSFMSILRPGLNGEKHKVAGLILNLSPYDFETYHLMKMRPATLRILITMFCYLASEGNSKNSEKMKKTHHVILLLKLAFLPRKGRNCLKTGEVNSGILRKQRVLFGNFGGAGQSQNCTEIDRIRRFSG